MNAFCNNLFTKKLSVENQMSLIAKYEPVLTFWQWHSQDSPWQLWGGVEVPQILPGLWVQKQAFPPPTAELTDLHVLADQMVLQIVF